MIRSSALARKYASAMLNVLTKELTKEELEQLDALIAYFNEHSEALFYLKLAFIKADVKQALLKKLYARFGIDGLLDAVTELLAQHQRLGLLPEVIVAIRRLYKERQGIADCVIMSSHALNEEQVLVLQNFVKSATGKTIISKHVIDKALIAGVRIQGDTFLWEHSVRQQLQALKNLF
jgi:F-type H+-transporting ATPase subunit delta